MKVYESSIQLKRQYKRLPQIKITNKKLLRAGFQVGKEYKIIYQSGKIILEIISSN